MTWRFLLIAASSLAAVDAVQVHTVELNTTINHTLSVTEGDFVHFHWSLSEPLSLIGPYDGPRFELLDQIPARTAPLGEDEAILHEPKASGNIVKQYFNPGIFTYISGTHESIFIRVFVTPANAPNGCEQRPLSPNHGTDFRANTEYSTVYQSRTSQYTSLYLKLGRDNLKDAVAVEYKTSSTGRSDQVMLYPDKTHPAIYNYGDWEHNDQERYAVDFTPAEDARLEQWFCYSCDPVAVIKGEVSCASSNYNTALFSVFDPRPAAVATVVVKANIPMKSITIRPGDLVAFDVDAGQYLTSPGRIDAGQRNEHMYLPKGNVRRTYFKSFFRPGYFTYSSATHSVMVAVEPVNCWNIPSFANSNNNVSRSLSNGDGRLGTSMEISWDTMFENKPGRNYWVKTGYYDVTPNPDTELYFKIEVQDVFRSTASTSIRNDASRPRLMLQSLSDSGKVTRAGKIMITMGLRLIFGRNVASNLTVVAQTAVCWTCSFTDLMIGNCNNGPGYYTPSDHNPGTRSPTTTTASTTTTTTPGTGSSSTSSTTTTTTTTTTVNAADPLIYDDNCQFIPMTRSACDICPGLYDDGPVFTEACCAAMETMCQRSDSPTEPCQIRRVNCDHDGGGGEWDYDNDYEYNDFGSCPFSMSVANSPCTADACARTSNTQLTKDCCTAIQAYCVSSNDAGCRTDGSSYERSYCNGDVANITGVITLSGLPAEVLQDFAVIAAATNEGSGSGSGSGSDNGSQYSGVASYMTFLVETYLTQMFSAAQQERRNNIEGDGIGYSGELLVDVTPEVTGPNTVDLKWSVPVLSAQQSQYILTKSQQIEPTAVVTAIQTGVAQAYGSNLGLTGLSASKTDATRVVVSPDFTTGETSSKKSNGGAIAGGVVGALLLVAAAAAALVLAQRKRNNKTAAGSMYKDHPGAEAVALSNPIYDGDAKA